jgi:alpha-1,6-mannosyltransferase
MKICDLTQSYAPTGGGVRTYLHAKRAHLANGSAGHEHVLIVPGPRDSEVREGAHVTYTVASPLVPGSRVYRLLYRSDKVLRILRREAPDVIEVHCAYNLPWTALYHRRRTPAARLVGVYMTDLPNAYVEPVAKRVLGRWGGSRATRMAERYVRALYGRLDATVAISPALADRLQALRVPDVHCVPLGVDLNVFSPSRRDESVRRELGVPPDGVLLAYAGRLDGEKRAALVMDAFERLRPELGVHLVLVGDGPLREELGERASRTGRARVVPFMSDRGELATLLASADVYVSAMPYETFGLSVIEAQACGLPVVGVAGGAMVDRVPPGRGVGLLGRADSVDDLVLNLESMIGDAARAEAGRRGRALVEESFSWEATFSRMLDLYRSLTPGRAG